MHDRGLLGREQATIAHDRLAMNHDKREVTGVALSDEALDRVPDGLEVRLPQVEDEEIDPSEREQLRKLIERA